MKRAISMLILAAPVALAAPLLAEDIAAPPMPAPGSVSAAQALEAWTRIEAVVTHPRCANCHVGPDNVPMWTIVGETETRPHGMHVNAGESRIGAETLQCSTCHVTSAMPNDMPQAPPHAGVDWQLAPVEMQWFGMSGRDICAQLKDPARNGGRDGAGLVEHLVHDANLKGTIHWGFVPGGGREPAPGGFENHLRDIQTWVAGGQPCPG